MWLTILVEGLAEAAAISLTAAVVVVVYQALRAGRADVGRVGPTAPPG